MQELFASGIPHLAWILLPCQATRYQEQRLHNQTLNRIITRFTPDPMPSLIPSSGKPKTMKFCILGMVWKWATPNLMVYQCVFSCSHQDFRVWCKPVVGETRGSAVLPGPIAEQRGGRPKLRSGFLWPFSVAMATQPGVVWALYCS